MNYFTQIIASPRRRYFRTQPSSRPDCDRSTGNRAAAYAPTGHGRPERPERKSVSVVCGRCRVPVFRNRRPRSVQVTQRRRGIVVRRTGIPARKPANRPPEARKIRWKVPPEKAYIRADTDSSRRRPPKRLRARHPVATSRRENAFRHRASRRHRKPYYAYCRSAPYRRPPSGTARPASSVSD